MKHIIVGSLMAVVLVGAHAQSEVFLCVDDTGKKEYKNTGLTKGCKKVDLPGITMIPAPPSAKKAQSQSPSQQTASARSASSPADFPKVDSGTQKSRDSDRKQILLDEMRAEEQKLANLRKDFNNGEPERRGDERNYAKYQERVAMMKEDIDRSEKNIEALKRELGNIR
jgi:predicted RNase H-like nuclease (RuvC/YqgF family)